MQLEDRMKVLEDEMKVLKNQIQSTLLDIQEQVLIHYYPSLRAEGSSPSEDTRPSVKPLPPEKGKTVLEETPTPSSSAVLLEEIKEAESPLSAKGQPSPPSEKEIDQATLIDLVEWVSDSVEGIGGRRTRKMVEKYAEERYLTLGVKDILLRLIPSGSEETPAKKVGIKETLDILLKLNKILGLKRETDVLMALSFIDDIAGEETRSHHHQVENGPASTPKEEEPWTR